MLPFWSSTHMSSARQSAPSLRVQSMQRRGTRAKKKKRRPAGRNDRRMWGGKKKKGRRKNGNLREHARARRRWGSDREWRRRRTPSVSRKDACARQTLQEAETKGKKGKMEEGERGEQERRSVEHRRTSWPGRRRGRAALRMENAEARQRRRARRVYGVYGAGTLAAKKNGAMGGVKRNSKAGQGKGGRRKEAGLEKSARASDGPSAGALESMEKQTGAGKRGGGGEVADHCGWGKLCEKSVADQTRRSSFFFLHSLHLGRSRPTRTRRRHIVSYILRVCCCSDVRWQHGAGIRGAREGSGGEGSLSLETQCGIAVVLPPVCCCSSSVPLIISVFPAWLASTCLLMLSPARGPFVVPSAAVYPVLERRTGIAPYRCLCNGGVPAQRRPAVTLCTFSFFIRGRTLCIVRGWHAWRGAGEAISGRRSRGRTKADL